jgi:hypothetical protein
MKSRLPRGKIDENLMRLANTNWFKLMRVCENFLKAAD